MKRGACETLRLHEGAVRPRARRFRFAGTCRLHVETACERGWSNLRDSALPGRAEAEGFELPITTDRSLRHQRNPDARRLSVLVLTSTSRPRIEARVDGIVAAIEGNAPGECVEFPIRESVFGLVTKQLPRIAFGWLPCWPSC